SDGRALDHFRRELAGAEVPDLPGAPPPGAARPDAPGGAAYARLSGGAGTALARLARDAEATPFAALLGLVAAFLARYADTGDVVIATPVADRAPPQLRRLVGPL